MLRMLERGAAVLPVHDSFIVRSSYKEELEEVMSQVFLERYRVESRMKAELNVLEESSLAKQREGHNAKLVPQRFGLIAYFEEMKRYSRHNNLWGMN